MPSPANKKQRQLLKVFKKLSATEQATLMSFAEFLLSRSAEISSEDSPFQDKKPILDKPEPIPRPENESVIKAIKRLTATYPMVNKENILHPISGLMSAHIMQGKAAKLVIDELEILFSGEYEIMNNNKKDNN